MMGLTDIFTPNPALNYTFLFYAYLFLSLGAVLLYILNQSQIVGIEGLYIIPSPAVLGLIYVSILRLRVNNTKKKD